MKYLYTILLMSLPFVVSAQIPLDSFYQQGTTWCGYEYFGSTTHSYPMSHVVFLIGKDTTLANKTYRIVRANFINSKALGAIRTDSTKVYYYKLDSSAISPVYGHSRAFAALPYMQEAILYDFGLKIGDTVAWKPAGNKTVVDIQQVQLSDGRMVNKYLFENTEYDYWIYGIGGCGGLFGSMMYFPPAKVQTYMGSRFYYNFPFVQRIETGSCFPVAVQKEIERISVKKVYPNPLNTDVVTIETDVDITSFIVTDMQGRTCYIYPTLLKAGVSTIKLPITAGLYVITFTDKDMKRSYIKIQKD